jgi:hypothetical protein
VTLRRIDLGHASGRRRPNTGSLGRRRQPHRRSRRRSGTRSDRPRYAMPWDPLTATRRG